MSHFNYLNCCYPFNFLCVRSYLFIVISFVVVFVCYHFTKPKAQAQGSTNKMEAQCTRPNRPISKTGQPWPAEPYNTNDTKNSATRLSLVPARPITIISLLQAMAQHEAFFPLAKQYPMHATALKGDKLKQVSSIFIGLN